MTEFDSSRGGLEFSHRFKRIVFGLCLGLQNFVFSSQLYTDKNSVVDLLRQLLLVNTNSNGRKHNPITGMLSQYLMLF